MLITPDGESPGQEKTRAAVKLAGCVKGGERLGFGLRSQCSEQRHGGINSGGVVVRVDSEEFDRGLRGCQSLWLPETPFQNEAAFPCPCQAVGFLPACRGIWTGVVILNDNRGRDLSCLHGLR